MQPSYIKLYQNGTLIKRVKAAENILKHCTLCPHNCRVNRKNSATGKCRSGKQATVAIYFAHRGEEPPISGRHGSGTIFFSHCTGQCIFCQNYDISQRVMAKAITNTELANMMLTLQKWQCHNINLVSPTHYVPQVLEALYIATEQGLNIPLVYNTSGFENISTLKLLDGIIDIYLPDMKYADNSVARELSGMPNYCEINRAAIGEMHCQVGNLFVDKNGIAKKGMIIRHLVLPNNLSQTKEILLYIKEYFPKNIHISLMSQYFPAYKASSHKKLNRPLSKKEYFAAKKLLDDLEFINGWVQLL